MKVNGTIINYYIHCKRQCYLCANRLNLDDNSEVVKRWRWGFCLYNKINE